jgi:hypothetical protein
LCKREEKGLGRRTPQLILRLSLIFSGEEGEHHE